MEQEALEVAALAAEARNARDVVRRTRAQRRAVRAQRKHLLSHLASLRETGRFKVDCVSDAHVFQTRAAYSISSESAVEDWRVTRGLGRGARRCVGHALHRSLHTTRVPRV